jgi:hypothetical protein
MDHRRDKTDEQRAQRMTGALVLVDELRAIRMLLTPREK